MINELSITIWGREFLLPIVYDCYERENITEEQTKAIDFFAEHLEWIEKSKSEVEKYCKDEVMEDDQNEKKDNIFSYIKPERLFVKRDNKYSRVAIMCKYRYDIEHGLAVVFSQDGKVTVGSENIIL